MRKIFFSVLAISLLATSAAFAGGGKSGVKKSKATTTCSSNCPKSKDCPKGGICPNKPGCVCH